MSENITKIQDPTVYIKSGEKLLKFLQDNFKTLNKKLPENIKHLINNKEALLKDSDINWLNDFLKDQRKIDNNELLTGEKLYCEIEKIIANNYSGFDFDSFIKEKNKNYTYLHELLNGSNLVLPENKKVERNPVLAKRIERLKNEQEERKYKEMIKNVDKSRKHMIEDTISFQMNMMNRHLIAVAQFVLSVIAGFAFGFFGIELIVGDLNFGFRLLLGITCALTIAVAEFYFLVKHLNEEEIQGTKEKEKSSAPVFKTKGKLHKD